MSASNERPAGQIIAYQAEDGRSSMPMTIRSQAQSQAHFLFIYRGDGGGPRSFPRRTGTPDGLKPTPIPMRNADCRQDAISCRCMRMVRCWPQREPA